MLICGTQARAEQASATQGAVSAELSFTSNVAAQPLSLRITRDGVATVFEGLGDPDAGSEQGWTTSSDYEPPLIVRDLDGDGEPEVLVRLYSTGAHCCLRSVIASVAPGGSYGLSTQNWLDASWTLNDLDADGIPEFVSWDPRWGYWATSYAESARPLRIWSFGGGALVDTTANHRPQLLKDQAQQLRRFQAGRNRQSEGFGPLAAYMADAYVLGTQRAGWLRIYSAYRHRGRERFFAALRSKLAALGYRARSERVPPVTKVPREVPVVGCNRQGKIAARVRPGACVFQDQRYPGDAGYNEVQGLRWTGWGEDAASSPGVAVGYSFATESVVRRPTQVRLSAPRRGCDGRLWYSRARILYSGRWSAVELPTCPGKFF